MEPIVGIRLPGLVSNYSVTRTGDVYRIGSVEPLKIERTDTYPIVKLLTTGHVETIRFVHQLVAQAFVGDLHRDVYVDYILRPQLQYDYGKPLSHGPSKVGQKWANVTKYMRTNKSLHAENLSIRLGVDGLLDYRDGLPELGGGSYATSASSHVRLIETGEIYRSGRDAALHIDGDHSSIYACLKGRRSSHKGYSFEYVSDEKRRQLEKTKNFLDGWTEADLRRNHVVMK